MVMCEGGTVSPVLDLSFLSRKGSGVMGLVFWSLPRLLPCREGLGFLGAAITG